MNGLEQLREHTLSPLLEYARRNGGPDTATEAAEFVKQAAKGGDPEAQYRLGSLLRQGRLVLRTAGLEESIVQPLGADDAAIEMEALRWHELAAAQGHSDAAICAGLMYVGGKGGETDHTKGLEYLRAAAKQEKPDAWFFMGQAYGKGWGVSRDPSEAANWFLRAAERGHSHAQGILAAMYERGEGITANFSEALRCYKSAAQQGHFHSAFRLARLHAEGKQVEQNFAEALKWFEVTANKGFGPEKVHALIWIGSIHEHGLTGEKNVATAREWYEKAHQEAALFVKELVPLTQKYLAGLEDESHSQDSQDQDG